MAPDNIIKVRHPDAMSEIEHEREQNDRWIGEIEAEKKPNAPLLHILFGKKKAFYLFSIQLQLKQEPDYETNKIKICEIHRIQNVSIARYSIA